MRPLLKNKNTGFTVVETIFYIFIFTIVSIVVIDALINMTKSFRETSIYTSLMQGGDIMERVSREIKQADGIHTISATNLKLNTTDSDGQARTVTFSLSGTDLQMYENDVLVANVNTANLLVSNLNFTSISTTAGAAVKFSFSIRSTKDSQNRLHDFYNTVALRGNY